MKDAWLMHNCKMNLNLDHLYCHTNETAYIRSSSTTSDIASVRKEVKQLKTMLLLHLDLIQQQSDQLMSKDKLLASLRQENEILKLKVERLDRRAKIINKRENLTAAVESENTTDSCGSSGRAKDDIFKKISTKLLNSCSIKLDAQVTAIGDDEDSKSTPPDEPTNQTPVNSNGECQPPHMDDVATEDNRETEPTAVINSIIGESNGKYIHKIMLQRIPSDQLLDDPKIILKDCVHVVDKKEMIDDCEINAEPIDEKYSIATLENHDGNQNKIMETNAICDRKPSLLLEDIETKEFAPLPIEQHVDVSTDLTTILLRRTSDQLNHQQQPQKRCLVSDESEFQYAMSSGKRNYNRPKYMTTKQTYRSREWKMDELETELNRQIVERGESSVLQSANINLEVPKWTIRECTSLYCIEGTEDLGDEVFLKRHARQEHHEKKRKKWDVQRIREQRTIERLKRRHYKDEAIDSQPNESELLTSFYPSVENIKFVQITDDLPIQAFGEGIPSIHRGDFSLPWHHHHLHHHHHNHHHHRSQLCTINQMGPDGVGGSKSIQSSNPSQQYTTTSIVFAIKKRIHRKSNSGGSINMGTSSPLRGKSTFRRNRSRR